jgi:hypothetical protein
MEKRNSMTFTPNINKQSKTLKRDTSALIEDAYRRQGVKKQLNTILAKKAKDTLEPA